MFENLEILTIFFFQVYVESRVEKLIKFSTLGNIRYFEILRCSIMTVRIAIEKQIFLKSYDSIKILFLSILSQNKYSNLVQYSLTKMCQFNWKILTQWNC